MTPGSVVVVVVGGVFVGLLAWGLSKDLERWLDERAWCRVERRVAQRYGVAPPPPRAYRDHQRPTRKSTALKNLQQYTQAVEAKRMDATFAQALKEIRGLPEVNEDA